MWGYVLNLWLVYLFNKGCYFMLRYHTAIVVDSLIFLILAEYRSIEFSTSIQTNMAYYYIFMYSIYVI